jgi:putative ABC transport system ATP-binding protein
MMILETRNIQVERKGGLHLRYPDLSLHKNDLCLLTGGSGSGKTTLLSVLAGLLPPSTGTVSFMGQDIYALASGPRNRLRGQNIGFVFQTLHLLPSLTLKQNIALASDMSGENAQEERVINLLNRLHLLDRAHDRPDKLSQGEQQRAAIARAVLNKPAIIFADEPTSALDRANAARVIDLLQREAQDSGAALLVATHDDRIMNAFPMTISLDASKETKAA